MDATKFIAALQHVELSPRDYILYSKHAEAGHWNIIRSMLKTQIDVTKQLHQETIMLEWLFNLIPK